jgi:hypothetical protein
MSYIFIIGPAYNNLNCLLNTIQVNNKILENIKHFYIPTNDIQIYNYFQNQKEYDNITCNFYCENQGHQLSCYNCIIAGMKMLLLYDNEKNNDIIIFSHEDCYLNNISLFNKAVNKLKTYDIVCREFNTKNKNKQNYYINDTFIINKNVIDYTFQHLEILNNFENENNPKNRFCEFFFSKTISKLNIFSILYNHTTWDNTELGFYHIPSRNYTELNWDKRNIDSIYNENN